MEWMEWTERRSADVKFGGWKLERGDLQAAFEGRPFKWETFFAATHSHSRVVLKKATPNRVAEDHGSERQKKEGRVCSGVFDLLPACRV